MKRNYSQMMFDEDRYLYVVCMYSTGKYSHSLHMIRLVDLIMGSGRHRRGTKKPKKLPKPVLKLSYNQYPGFMGFLSVGTKIYMFGGEESYREKPQELCKRCYVFDTYQNPHNIVKDGPSMNHPKFMPLVLGPLHGKFYVLSSNLASFDLEEFDPKMESWNSLPYPAIDCEEKLKDPCEEKLKDACEGLKDLKGPCEEKLKDACEGFKDPCEENIKDACEGLKDHCEEKLNDACERFKDLVDGFVELKDWRHDYEVLSHAIVNNSLLFSTPKGIYTFDVINKKWKHFWSFGGEKMFPYIHEAKLLDGFWYAFPLSRLSRLQAYLFDEVKGFQHYKVRGVRHPSKLVKHEAINIMVPLGDRRFCVVRSGLPENDIDFYVTVDMCELTKKKMRSNGKPNLKVSTQYSITYVKKDKWLTPLITTCLVV